MSDEAAKKVLIVDDAVFMRKMISNILTKAGFEVVGEAKNGKDAIVKYKKYKPALVTMDMIMPEMGGIHAVKEIKKLDRHANIVIVSAMGQQHLVVEAIKAGARDFIVKPFENNQMLTTLKKYIK